MTAIECKTQFEEWLEIQPKEIPCGAHPDQKRKLSEGETREAHPTFQHESLWKPEYFSCPKCADERKRDRLLNYGTPNVLLHCAFDNWTAQTETERGHLESVRKFAEVKRGFLILLGPVGLGKSHLAVAVLRNFKSSVTWGDDRNSGEPVFVKQSTLLRRLRETYRDDKAADPVTKCQRAKILVLDEVGLSSGGKDELPMLHEILDYRYSYFLPTVITSNLSLNELGTELGERLADRLSEAAHAILIFSGESHRPNRREHYFK
jgi:DNA replication protein DnaC